MADGYMQRWHGDMLQNIEIVAVEHTLARQIVNPITGRPLAPCGSTSCNYDSTGDLWGQGMTVRCRARVAAQVSGPPSATTGCLQVCSQQ